MGWRRLQEQHDLRVVDWVVKIRARREEGQSRPLRLGILVDQMGERGGWAAW